MRKARGSALQTRESAPSMPFALDLLNFAALILAGIAGALLCDPFSNAVRLVAARVRTERRRR